MGAERFDDENEDFMRGFREGMRAMDHPYRIAAVNAERRRDEALELLRRARALFPIEKPEQGGDPGWVASIKRDVAAALEGEGHGG